MKNKFKIIYDNCSFTLGDNIQLSGEHIVTLFIGFGFAIVIIIFGVDSIHNATLSSMLP